jgi:pimeloyl-ACP methyl ester carboxylesterase
VVELNLLYVHGLKSCSGSRQDAENSLDELETAVNAVLPARIASWEASHPGKHLVVQSARANVYTAPPSGIHPSDSPDPLAMDDWEIGDPGCSTTQQGDPCTTAYEWRFRLAEEVNRLYPAPMKNVVLIGHSNGARAAMEVAANLGTGGVGTHNWGVQSRIAGVVTLHGVVDDIGSSKYDVVGISSFESSCKFGDAITGFGDSCAPGNGFCEWVARVDASPAADWVASNKRALMLSSWGSCSPSAWSGRSDGSLPYDAQASPLAVGLDMTPAPGETWREVHGQRYGAFCHSDLTNPSNTNHVAARTAARDRILDWLFVAAPRVAASGSNATASIGFNQSTATFTMGTSCAAGEVDDTLTQGPRAPGSTWSASAGIRASSTATTTPSRSPSSR